MFHIGKKNASIRRVPLSLYLSLSLSLSLVAYYYFLGIVFCLFLFCVGS